MTGLRIAVLAACVCAVVPALADGPTKKVEAAAGPACAAGPSDAPAVARISRLAEARGEVLAAAAKHPPPPAFRVRGGSVPSAVAPLGVAVAPRPRRPRPDAPLPSPASTSRLPRHAASRAACRWGSPSDPVPDA